MDFDLTRLGAREFEHLTQALSLKALGLGTMVFGDGPDGGREASFNGRVTFPDPDPEGRWEGDGVVQAKFRQRPLGTGPDTEWFIAQLRAELNRWVDPASRRQKAGRLPHYLLLTTNVVLSPKAATGGIDTVNDLLTEYAAELGLRGWRVWHHDQICRMLEIHSEVRRCFRGMTVTGDVLSRLEDLLDSSQARPIGPELRTRAAKMLRTEQWVRLGQYAEKVLASALDYVVERGDAVLRPSKLAEWSTNGTGKQWPHIVLVGGPGQGKSTLGQLLTQIYRLVLLQGSPAGSLGPEASALAPAMAADFRSAGLPVPTARRWPLHINLAEYADAIAGGEQKSLLRFAAELVSRRTSDGVTVGQMKAWLAEWPWLLVLDGLDEVSTLSVRELLIERISDLLADAAADDVDADLLVVATTRPQGYRDELSPLNFQPMHLRELDVAAAIKYAQRLTAVRYTEDEETAGEILARVREAARSDTTARLMRSPLQVTIMSLILERRIRVPESRHALFAAYYETIYARETNKPGRIAVLLEERKEEVTYLHEEVGRLLHINAERSGDADAQMSLEDLLTLITERFTQSGYSSREAARIGGELVAAATQRLVLLVRLDVSAAQELRSASTRDNEQYCFVTRSASKGYWIESSRGSICQRKRSRTHLIQVGF